ncbi:MAG: hypothetical protein ACSHXL_06475, partial [Bacteroidota bacterium]
PALSLGLRKQHFLFSTPTKKHYESDAFFCAYIFWKDVGGNPSLRYHLVFESSTFSSQLPQRSITKVILFFCAYIFLERRRG